MHDYKTEQSEDEYKDEVRIDDANLAAHFIVNEQHSRLEAIAAVQTLRANQASAQESTTAATQGDDGSLVYFEPSCIEPKFNPAQAVQRQAIAKALLATNLL